MDTYYCCAILVIDRERKHYYIGKDSKVTGVNINNYNMIVSIFGLVLVYIPSSLTRNRCMARQAIACHLLLVAHSYSAYYHVQLVIAPDEKGVRFVGEESGSKVEGASCSGGARSSCDYTCEVYIAAPPFIVF